MKFLADRKRFWTRRRILVVLGLVLAAGVVVRIATWRNRGVIISPETTFITGPLRDDGTVDYLAAVNNRSSQGVTPENNAGILLLRALGPARLAEPSRERFFQMIGIDPLPEKGPYLEDFVDYCLRNGSGVGASAAGQPPDSSEINENRDRITSRPWTKTDSPLAAAWLEENKRPIDLVVAATGRPRFYWPLLPDRDGEALVTETWLDSVAVLWHVAFDLRARAMLRIGEGKPDEAWQDLLASHQLARLVSQAPTTLAGATAIRIEEMTIGGDAALSHEGKLTGEQARQYAAELGKLPPMTKLADRVNWIMRLEYLDLIVATSRGGWSRDAATKHFFGEKEDTSLGRRLDIATTDWNEPMRIGNRWYDRLAAALSKPTWRERLAAWEDAERDFQPVLDRAKGDGSILRKIRSACGLAGDVSKQLAAAAIFRTRIGFTANDEDEAAVRRDIAQLAFTLAAYRADHGTYPADLAALVPKYVPAVPKDIFATGPLHYRREGEGYLLYSVGPDGVDDGGRRYSDPDAPNGSEWGDNAIRVPAKQK